MHDPHQHGHAVTLSLMGEPALAHDRKLGYPIAASLVHVGRDGLRALFASGALRATFEAGTPVVAICSNPHEAFALRGAQSVARRSPDADRWRVLALAATGREAAEEG